jgi:hypothetical protein
VIGAPFISLGGAVAFDLVLAMNHCRRRHVVRDAHRGDAQRRKRPISSMIERSEYSVPVWSVGLKLTSMPPMS